MYVNLLLVVVHESKRIVTEETTKLRASGSSICTGRMNYVDGIISSC